MLTAILLMLCLFVKHGLSTNMTAICLPITIINYIVVIVLGGEAAAFVPTLDPIIKQHYLIL